ncbi:hypothetical protein ACFE04_012163 [Oxalis oulophora]
MGAAGEEEPKQLLGPCNGEEKICLSVRLRPLNSKETSRYDVVDWESSVFAYGQTSSGKTYTMSGITEYAVADIFDYTLKHKEREFISKFFGMEIYNESVKDPLSTDSSPRRLLDDPETGTVVERLTEETLRDWNYFKELLSVCQAQRQIGETALNEGSSRSHQILRLAIKSCAREFSGNDNKSSILAATVNFVDLAESEGASQSLSAGARLKEGCHINRSLLTLGTVVPTLAREDERITDLNFLIRPKLYEANCHAERKKILMAFKTSKDVYTVFLSKVFTQTSGIYIKAEP